MHSILLINRYFISVIIKIFKKTHYVYKKIYKIVLSIKITEYNIYLIVIGEFRN